MSFIQYTRNSIKLFNLFEIFLFLLYICKNMYIFTVIINKMMKNSVKLCEIV